MQETDQHTPLEHSHDELVFRVLAGPQRGAEMRLRAGEYVIGSGDQCDIVLVDDGIAEEHLAVRVSESGVELKALENLVAYGDEKLLHPGESVVEAGPVAIAFGLAAVGLGLPDTDWSMFKPPDVATSLERAAEAANRDEAAGEEDQTDSVSDEKKPETHISEGDGSEQDGQSAEDKEPTFSEPVMSKLRAAAVVAVLLGASVTISGVVAPGIGKAAQDDNTQGLSSNPDAVEQLLSTAGLLEVDAVLDEGGKLVLSGYVANKAAYERMLKALETNDVSFDNQVHQVNELVASINATLEEHLWPAAEFEAHLRTRYHGAGAFVIDGYLGPEVEQTELKRRVLGDAPGIRSLTFTRSRLSDWRTIMANKIAAAGLDDWLKVTADAGALHIEGTLTPREANVWRAVGNEFVAESNGWPKLSVAVQSTGAVPAGNAAATPGYASPPQNRQPAKPLLDSNIIGVISAQGRPGRVLLDNGQNLKEGDSLQNGAVLQSVSAEKVIIRKGEHSFAYHIKEAL